MRVTVLFAGYPSRYKKALYLCADVFSVFLRICVSTAPAPSSDDRNVLVLVLRYRYRYSTLLDTGTWRRGGCD